MNSILVEEFDSDPDLLREFVALPWKIHRGDPRWTPPNPDVVAAQLSPSHPFFRHGRSRKLVAVDARGEICGRVCAIVNDKLSAPSGRVGHVGFFECCERFDVARALLDSAHSHLRRWGVDEVWGPVNYATLYSYRLLTSGFDEPSFYTDVYNPPYYPEFFEAYGYRTLRRYSSDIVELPYEELGGLESTYAYARRRLARSGFTIRPVEPGLFEPEMEVFHALVHSIFRDNFGFSDLPFEEFLKLYEPYRGLLRPEHLLFAHDSRGEPVGFFLSYPDFTGNNPRTYVGKMLGVRREFLRHGVGAALVGEAMQTYARGGYVRCISSLRIAGNASESYGAAHARRWKEYKLYSYRL